MDYPLLYRAVDKVRTKWPEARPAAGMICGSGWGDVADVFTVRGTLGYEEIPGIGRPGVTGHSGCLVWAESAGKELLIFQGRRHYYEGIGWSPIAIPVFISLQFKLSALLLTNAAGCMREDMKPGDLMLISDHINMMSNHPLIGEHNPVWGPRFPDMSYAYDPDLRTALSQAADQLGQSLHDGVYVATSGPTYESPAEVKAFQMMGGDAVGMSTVPEALLAHAAGLRVAGLSCMTNYAAGISRIALSHEEVTETSNAAMPRMKALVKQFFEDLALNP